MKEQTTPQKMSLVRLRGVDLAMELGTNGVVIITSYNKPMAAVVPYPKNRFEFLKSLTEIANTLFPEKD